MRETNGSGRAAVESDQVEVFIVLAEELHFGRTAERLYVSQPRVSRLLAALEREVGGVLLDRTSRRVRLTPLGARLRDRLGPAHSEIRAALDEARTTARETTGGLRIGTTATTWGHPLSRLVQAFETRHPDCEVTVREVSVLTPYDALRDGDVDVLVNWLAVDEPDLTVGPAIDHQRRVLMVAADHPLASRASVSAEEIADWPHLRMDERHPRASQEAFAPSYAPSGRAVRFHPHTIRAMGEMIGMVVRGQAVHPTVTSMSALTHRDDVVLVPISDMPPLPLGLIWCTAHENARIRALAAPVEPPWGDP